MGLIKISCGHTQLIDKKFPAGGLVTIERETKEKDNKLYKNTLNGKGIALENTVYKIFQYMRIKHIDFV